MNPSIDLRAIAEAAMRDRELWPEFSAQAQQQAQATPAAPPAQEAAKAQDLRALPWCSIDNEDSLDLDQLSVAEALPDGSARLWVAIADVDALVPQGSPIDAHAAHNTTSVYTAAGIFAMLPTRLSNELSSLHEGHDRLALVAGMRVAADGEVSEPQVLRALVRNRAKLVYEGVADWLDGKAPPPPKLAAVAGLDEQLRLQDGIAQRLRARRVRRGALNLKTSEARPVFEGGQLVDLRGDERNRAKELIADLMIATNGVTAQFLDAHGLPSIRRLLKAPARWDRIVKLAAEHGHALPAVADALALEAFLDARRQADPARFADLSLAIVKLLGAGEYAVSRPAVNGGGNGGGNLNGGGPTPGHFGLAVNDYAHSTAPNRRFPDLVTQRLLKAALDGRASPYGDDELEALAAHCSRQESNANHVERLVRKAAAALLLDGRIGERFDAIVTGVTSKGTFVRITRPMVEGRVMRGFEGMDVGDKVQVQLVGVDARQGHIDFEGV